MYRQLTPVQSSILDAARYIAAMMVALHHGLGYFYGAAYRSISQESFWSNLGAMGVAIFFTLSGFVICYSSLTKLRSKTNYNFTTYAIERAVRIYLVFIPAMLLAVLVNLANLAWIGDSISGAQYFTLQSFLATLTMLSGIVNGHAEIMPLVGPAWTINYEFWLYMLFGLAVIPLPWFGTKTQALIRIIAFMAILALSMRLQSFTSLAPLWIGGAIGAAIFLHWPQEASPAPAKPLPQHLQFIPRAAAYSYSLYLTHLLVIWACRLVGYSTGIYEFDVNDWRKFSVFAATMILTNLAAYGFSNLTEQHTNTVRKLLLSRNAKNRSCVISRKHSSNPE